MIFIKNIHLKNKERVIIQLTGLSKEVLDKFPYRGVASTGELTKLINGKNSILDMKKMLDIQYSRASDLQAIINYLELLKMLELIEM